METTVDCTIVRRHSIRETQELAFVQTLWLWVSVFAYWFCSFSPSFIFFSFKNDLNYYDAFCWWAFRYQLLHHEFLFFQVAIVWGMCGTLMQFSLIVGKFSKYPIVCVFMKKTLGCFGNIQNFELDKLRFPSYFLPLKEFLSVIINIIFHFLWSENDESFLVHYRCVVVDDLLFHTLLQSPITITVSIGIFTLMEQFHLNAKQQVSHHSTFLNSIFQLFCCFHSQWIFFILFWIYLNGLFYPICFCLYFFVQESSVRIFFQLVRVQEDMEC